MPFQPSRRQALVLGSGVGTALLSGCAGLPFSDSRLTLTLLNFDNQLHRLSVELLRTEDDELSEAIALDQEFELQPPAEESAVFSIQKPKLLESGKYIVRAHLSDNESVREQYTFYPDCTDSGEQEDRILIEIHRQEGDSEPYIRFQQDRCGDSGWF